MACGPGACSLVINENHLQHGLLKGIGAMLQGQEKAGELMERASGSVWLHKTKKQKQSIGKPYGWL